MIDNQTTSFEKNENSISTTDAQAQLSTSIWDDIKSAARAVLPALGDAAKSADQSGQLDMNTGLLYLDDAFASNKAKTADKPITPDPLDMKPITPDPLDKAASILIAPEPLDAKKGSRQTKDNNGAGATDNPSSRKASTEPYGENNPFHGAEINKDVEPGTHKVGPGDNLTKIAREHLGSGATAQDVQKHIDEIARINHIKNPNLILDGQVLKLPGHTADGGTVTTNEAGDKITSWKDNTVRVDRTGNTGYVKTPDGTELHWGPKNRDNYTVTITDDGGRAIRDYNGNTTTTWDDGVVRTENTDGTGNVRRTADGGGYTQHNWGPMAEDNFDVIKTADNKYRIADGEGDKVGHEPKTETEKLQAEKSRLNDRLQEKLGNDPEALARAKEDMKAFEKRATEQKPPLSAEEVVKTYEQISKLLESTGEQPVSQADRAKIAEQILNQAAHPNEVRQGYHNTCNVTTVESRIYTKYPSEAARLVTEAATTGQVTMKDGRVVQISASSLQPDSQAIHHPSPDNERSHASQIFQLAAVNDYYDRQNRSTVPPGQVRYEQVLPTGPNDTGERLMDYSTTPPSQVTDSAGNIKSAPGIPTSELETISNNVTGKNEKDFVIVNGKYGDANTVKVDSEDDLGEKLEQMKKDGKLPAIIWVDSQNEPFFTDSGAGTNGGAGGAHVVTITDYNPDTKQVQIDNQWQQAADHQVSLHDLYTATRTSIDQATIDELSGDVSWDRFFGTEDGFKEMELLRLQRNANKLTDAEYDAKIIEVMKEQEKRWKEDGETYPGEEQRTRDKYAQMLGFLPAARAQAIRNAVQNN